MEPCADNISGDRRGPGVFAKSPKKLTASYKAHTGDGETEAFTIDFASIEFNYNPIAEDELEEMLQSVFKAIGMGRAVSRAAPP
jgi:hypothetical protein